MKMEMVSVPFGYLEGVPSIKVLLEKDDPLDDVQAAIISRSASVGSRCIDISCVDWSDDKLPRFIVRMMDLCGESRIFSCRHAGSKEWCPVGIDWVLDVTEKFEKPMENDHFMKTILDASHVPAMNEVIWWSPPIEHITKWHIEAVFSNLGPLNGMWMYVDDEHFKIALSAAHKSYATCGIRSKNGRSIRPW